jgi:hypothetical protein
MSRPSSVELLVLHAVRLKGFADTSTIADRFGLDAGATLEHLLDAQATGWVTRSTFADLTGWSLSEAGRRRNEAQLHDELDRADARADIGGVHEAFRPLNVEAVTAFTAWQLGSAAGTAARYGHLGGLAQQLDSLEGRLTARLDRFAGYHGRFTRALANAVDDPRWITGVDVDSCHTVWFELHEDLTATLGVAR